jgi:hypothetical protein
MSKRTRCRDVTGRVIGAHRKREVISQHREAISPDTIRHPIDRVGDHDLTDPSSSREREETQRQPEGTRLSPWSDHTGSVTGVHRKRCAIRWIQQVYRT